MMSIRLDWTPAQLESVRASARTAWLRHPDWLRRVLAREWADLVADS
jgi:hypothetical protein